MTFPSKSLRFAGHLTDGLALDEARPPYRNSGELADAAKDMPSKTRYERMQDAWLALVEEQDWLDGVTPVESAAAE